MKVLLIENNPMDAWLIEEMLNESGDSSDSLESAERLDTGLELLARERFDILILDLSLPDSRGLDALYRTLSQTPELPVVVIADLEDEQVALEATRVGAQDYLLKGKLDDGVLTRALRYALERKHMEIELLQTTMELQSIFQALPDLFFRIRYDGTILDYRAGSITNLYLPPEEFHWKRIQEVLPPDVGWRIEEAIRTVGETGSMVSMEYSLSLPQGTQFFEARLLPLLKDQVVAVIRNITERKLLENELHKSNEELKAFAHTLSHDLRGSLSVVEGFSDAALRASEDGNKELERECLAHIIKGVQRVQGYIESLLHYAQADHPEDEVSSVDTDEVLLGVLTDIDEEIREKGVEVQYDSGFPLILASPIKLQQVLLNLIANALKYMGENPKPTIEIGARKEGNTVTLYVSDNGLGCPRKIIKKYSSPSSSLKSIKVPASV